MTPQSKRKLLILTYHRLELWIAPPWFAERLRREFPDVEVDQLNSYENVEQRLADVEILFGISIRPEQFLAARKLRWIHSQAAAVHQFMFPELVNSHVILTNARDVHGPVVAEQVIAMMFALARRIPAAVRFQQKHVWALAFTGVGRRYLGIGWPGEHRAQRGETCIGIGDASDRRARASRERKTAIRR
jgi:phosphoglycerate dehydrogenase-like enzyme